jgi:hypothetical protein
MQKAGSQNGRLEFGILRVHQHVAFKSYFVVNFFVCIFKRLCEILQDLFFKV